MSSTLLALRANSEANTAEQKRIVEKRRNILVLIHQHLIESGYFEAAERLQHEAGSVISKYEVADNVDFGQILGEYEAYYEMRFDKKPKLVRKLQEGESNSKTAAGRSSRQPDSSGTARKVSANKDKNDKNGTNGNMNTSGKLPVVAGATSTSTTTTINEDDNSNLSFGVSGTSMGGSSIDNINTKQKKTDADNAERDRERLEER